MKDVGRSLAKLTEVNPILVLTYTSYKGCLLSSQHCSFKNPQLWRTYHATTNYIILTSMAILSPGLRLLLLGVWHTSPVPSIGTGLLCSTPIRRARGVLLVAGSGGSCWLAVDWTVLHECGTHDLNQCAHVCRTLDGHSSAQYHSLGSYYFTR